MQKRNIFTRVIDTTWFLQVFTTNIDPILLVSKVKLFIIYVNSRVMIDSVADKYGDWSNRSKHRLQYLKLTDIMKKEEKFHMTQLFCVVKDIEVVEMESEGVTMSDIEDDDELFNPRVLFATSDGANAGIDNLDICGVLRVEIPPSLEDCVQKQGRAGCRPGSNALSGSCIICVSFESLLKLWYMIYIDTIDKLSY